MMRPSVGCVSEATSVCSPSGTLTKSGCTSDWLSGQQLEGALSRDRQMKSLAKRCRKSVMLVTWRSVMTWNSGPVPDSSTGCVTITSGTSIDTSSGATGTAASAGASSCARQTARGGTMSL